MAKNYEVIQIDQLTRNDPARGLVQYYRHRILTKQGTALRVDISEEDFTPEKAEPILQAAAANADAIKKL